MTKKQDIISSSQSMTLPDWLQQAGDVQTAIIQVNGHYAICEKLVEYGGNTGILIRLCPSISGNQGSTVLGSKTGKMITDTMWCKYWFIASAKVEIYPDQNSVAAGKIYLASDGPTTTENSHQIDSSITINAGFFGGTPTGGVAINSSFSTMINDFRVVNSSVFKEGHLIHSYDLAATSAGPFNPTGGSDFDWWVVLNPLILNPLNTGSMGNLFSKWPPFEPASPPPLSYSNFPIASQGFWVLPNSWTGKTTFTIDITVLCLGIYRTIFGIIGPPQLPVNHVSFSHRIPVQIDWNNLES